MYSLEELLHGFEYQSSKDLADISVNSVCFDTRVIQSKDVFFALSGSAQDGVSYIAEALKGGASAIVASHSLDSKFNNCDVPVVRVANPRLVLAFFADRLSNSPTRDFYLVGVTGTNGKTTLTYLIEQMWGSDQSGVIGTVNIRFGDQVRSATHTTPDPVALQKLFSEMKSVGTKRVAIEVSSHALEQERATPCAFDAAVFTNLTQDHLDYHGTMEEYFKSKEKLFVEILKNSCKQNKLAVVNIDDEYGKRIKKSVEEYGLVCQTFSMTDSNADCFPLEVDYRVEGTSAKLKTPVGEVFLKSSLIGEHNLKNIMAALLVGIHSRQYTVKQLGDVFKAVHVPGRLQRVLNSNFFVDYAHTPDALVNVLNAVREVLKGSEGKGRLGVVFGCGGDRDRKKRPLMGEASGLADFAIVTSDNPRTEDPDKIIKDIIPGVSDVHKNFDGETGYLVEVDRRKAIRKAVELARPEDVIVIAGKGHEDYQIIGTEKTHFDDCEEVVNALKV